MTKRFPRLGLDIGRLIINGDPSDLFRKAPALGRKRKESFVAVAPPVHMVFRYAQQLVKRRFGERVWLVSKCRRECTRRNIKVWLEDHDFFGRTGIPKDHVWFCNTNQEKGPIAMKLGLTHFADDNLEVLFHMPRIPHRFLFRPNPEEIARFGGVPDGITVITKGWRNLACAILET